MNKELLEKATIALLMAELGFKEAGAKNFLRSKQRVDVQGHYAKRAEAVLRVAIEACAEIAERDSVLDWAGGSTGNAVGTRIKIHKQIRALLTDEPAKEGE